MIDTKTLVSALAATVGVEPKTANVFTQDHHMTPTQALQGIVGTDEDPVSTFAQLSPETGHDPKASPLGPLQGDEAFFAYCLPGAIFQDKQGQTWQIEEYDFEGKVRISNIWYPRLQAVVNIQDVRNSIYAWTDPVQQVVPPPPAGVDYGVVDVRVVK
jgi:hypothetical protein